MNQKFCCLLCRWEPREWCEEVPKEWCPRIGAQGAVPGDHQPGVPERAGRGVPRGAKHNLQPSLTEDQGSPVPDCEEDPMLEKIQPLKKFMTLKGSDACKKINI